MTDGRTDGHLAHAIPSLPCVALQIKSNQIESGLFQATWPIKVKNYNRNRDRQRKREIKTYNIQHTQHTKIYQM